MRWILLAACLAALSPAFAAADPIASFEALPNPAAPGQDVDFDASASSAGDPLQSIVSYAWDFDGDGAFDTTSTDPFATYAFLSFGTFEVDLQVTTDTGAQAGTSLSIDVNQGNRAPVADPGGPYTILLGDDLTLDASGSYDPDAVYGDFILGYEWDLNGDGVFDTSGPAPSHFASATDLADLGLGYEGAYTVVLRVSDSFGATSTAEALLEIRAPAAVPEPASAALLGLGALGLWAFRRRRRQSSARR